MTHTLCFIFSLCLLITSCASFSGSFDRQSVSLKKDMSPEQVEHVLGKPTAKALSGSKETWSYGNERSVVFTDGKLSAFGKSNEPPNAASNASPQEAKKEIGAECTKDAECLSDNCHFLSGRCAGKNNCTVPLNGKICATDTDCCQGRCSFGTCRK